MEGAAVVVAGIHVLQEVGGRARRLGRIELEDDVAELGLDADAHRLGARLRVGAETATEGEQGSGDRRQES